MEIGGSMLSSLSLTGSDGIVRTSGNQVVRGVKNFVDRIITPLVYEPTGLITVLAEGGDVNINALNNISISNGYGINTIDSVLGSNVLSVYSSTKIETTDILNTINNTTNVLSTSGVASLTTTSATVDVNVTECVFNLCPTATVIHNFASSLSGFLLCNGTSYSTTTYARLFLVIGYTFGGSGANFNVPDLKGAFLRGAGLQNYLGVNHDGSTSGTKQNDATIAPIVSVTNPYLTNQGYRNVGSSGNQCVNRTRITTDPVDNTGILSNTSVSVSFARQEVEVRPFNVSINYFIRY